MKLAGCLFLVAIAACATHVKQASAPGADEFAESKDSDMAAAPEKGPAPVIKSADQVKHDCCAQCSDANGRDKKGDDPKTVPCADYTADLKEECLGFFRKTPMMASDAKTCAAEAAPAAAKSE